MSTQWHCLLAIMCVTLLCTFLTTSRYLVHENREHTWTHVNTNNGSSFPFWFSLGMHVGVCVWDSVCIRAREMIWSAAAFFFSFFFFLYFFNSLRLKQAYNQKHTQTRTLCMAVAYDSIHVYASWAHYIRMEPLCEHWASRLNKLDIILLSHHSRSKESWLLTAETTLNRKKPRGAHWKGMSHNVVSHVPGYFLHSLVLHMTIHTFHKWL